MVGRPTGLQVPPPVLRRRLLQDVGQGHARYDGAARREFPDYGAGQACYFENAKYVTVSRQVGAISIFSCAVQLSRKINTLPPSSLKLALILIADCCCPMASLPTSGRQRPIRIIRPRQLGVQFLASCQSNGAECQDTLCFKGLFCLVRDPSRRFTDRVGSSREDGPGGGINMLIFYCNPCNAMLTGCGQE